jgi:murein DD-endopeptidase MepM/ murein hydrolase activator NlpD
VPLKVSFNFDLEANSSAYSHSHPSKDKDENQQLVRRRLNKRDKDNIACWLLSLGTVLIAIAILNPGSSTWLDNFSLVNLAPPAVNNRTKPKQSELAPSFDTVFPLGKGKNNSFPITDVPGSCRDGCSRTHAGTDYGYAGNIYNGISGVIIEARASRVGGIVAVKSKRNGDDVTLRYVHLNLNSISKWKVGDRIQAGAVLGRIQETFPGSTGPHLHLEVYRNGTLDMKGYKYVAKL